jgi:hypothetical protein
MRRQLYLRVRTRCRGRCEGGVENLWMVRAKAVENRTAKKILMTVRQREARPRPTHRRLRAAFRLIVCNDRVRSSPLLTPRTTINVTVHRFEETICGRVYQIEVTPVSDRWRAQLRRTAGMPTAMMPFYGTSPDEAARQLAAWLTLAHRRVAAAAVPSA